MKDNEMKIELIYDDDTYMDIAAYAQAQVSEEHPNGLSVEEFVKAVIAAAILPKELEQ